MSLRPQKRRRSDVYLYEVEDPSEAEAAVQMAETVVGLVRARHISDPDHEEVRVAEQRRDEMQAKLAACFGRIDLLAPLRGELEALVQEDAERRSAEEAERKAAKAEGREVPEPSDEDDYLPDSFFIRLLEITAVPVGDEPRTTAKEWSEMLAGEEWLPEERLRLMDKVYSLSRHKQYDVGKGFGTIRNS